MAGMVADMHVNKDAMQKAAGSGFSTATDLADWLVREAGLPFRDAHHATGAAVALAEKAKAKALAYRHLMSSPELAKEFVLANTVGDKQNIWACLNKGLVCLHASDFSSANIHLENVLQCNDDRDWAISVKDFTKSVLSLKPEEQLLAVRNAIIHSRKLKKLPELEVSFGNVT